MTYFQVNIVNPKRKKKEKKELFTNLSLNSFRLLAKTGSFMARSKSQSPLSPRTDSPLSKSFPNNILFSSLATENKQKNNETNKQNNPAMVFTFPHQGVGAASSIRINSSSSYNNTHVSSLGSSMTSPLVGRGKYFIEFFFYEHRNRDMYSKQKKIKEL